MRVERQLQASEFVRGLLLDGERKSNAPDACSAVMCTRCANSSIRARVQAAHTTVLMGRVLSDAVLMLDETRFSKQGDQSVGVARQYFSAL